METLDLHIGDLVVVQIAQQTLIILVEALMNGQNIFLPEGHSLSSAPMLFPDAAPNAVPDILFCGPAQIYVPDKPVDMALFSGKPICVSQKDVLQHIARAQ